MQTLQLIQSNPNSKKLTKTLEAVSNVPLDQEDRNSLLEDLDLTERIVRGPVHEIDHICKKWISALNDSPGIRYEHASVDLYKYGKWAQIAPVCHINVFEVPELFAHFLVVVPEETAILGEDAVSSELIMKQFTAAWNDFFPSIHTEHKGSFKNSAKILEIAGYHDVMLSLRIKITHEEDSAFFFFVMPYAPIHVLKKKG